VRRPALALLDVKVTASDSFDFRVAANGFTWSYSERRQGKPRRIWTDVAGLYVCDEAENRALPRSEPGSSSPAREYDRWPLVLLRL